MNWKALKYALLTQLAIAAIVLITALREYTS